MKHLILIFVIMANTIVAQNFHDLTINSISGEEIKMSEFEGKKVLIVNVASYCGYTSQYSDLQKLYENHDNLVVIGVPCNQFGFQEPFSNDSISKFCSTKYSVDFPMTEKIKVKGKNQHPLYKWLTTKELNKVDDFKVSWNFNKFLIDEKGKFISYFGSSILPSSSKLTQYL